MRYLSGPLPTVIVAALAISSSVVAEDTDSSGALPRPVVVAPSSELQVTSGEAGVPAALRLSSELPASISNPGKLLSLATAGPASSPSLPLQSAGCNPRPILRCVGPDFCGCSSRLYYGTNPCDDDPVLTMSPTINDPLSRHWYQKAWQMVVRKKNIAAAINE